MLGYISGAYDILRQNDLNKIDMAVQKNLENGNEYMALAIYSDELCENLGMGTPLKKVEERMQIAQYISGINFTFKISSLDKEYINSRAEEALSQYLMQLTKPKKQEKKEYDIVYAPGTYDLFHAGHLENLLQAAAKGKKLIVGVKADELVFSHKGKAPMISALERMEIIRHLKFVDNVYQYYTRDPHAANSWIKSKYGKSVDAIFLGSDLKTDFMDITDIKIVFTERDQNLMQNRSTTAYRKKMEISGYSTLSGSFSKVEKNSETVKSQTTKDMEEEEK